VKHKNPNLESLNAALTKGIIYGEATNMARDLANERSDICTPAWMESKALELVNQYRNNLDIEIITAADMKTLGLNLFAAVGQGAAIPPRLIILK